MTTIILTIIGILLAAAAALMVIFYGGDAFNAGSVGAKANTLQNAGTNVISAVQLYRAEGATFPTAISTIGTQYLREEPALDGVGVIADAFVDGDTVTAGLQPQLQVTDVDADVCARVNKNLGRPEASTGKAGKMGCDTTDDVFFANL